MYIAKYELNNSLKVKQYILKINILNQSKNIKIYNFCLKQLIAIDKKSYLNIAFRVSIFDSKMELLLFFTVKEDFSFFYQLKKNIMLKFTSLECCVSIAEDRYKFDSFINLNNNLTVNRRDTSCYFIENQQIGIEFTIGNFVEKMINIAIEREWSFSYQFHLKPYSSVEKKELERYAKKYFLRLSDEVYIPDNLKIKFNSIVNSIASKDFFIDEVFSFEKGTKAFYEMMLSNEFALNLSKYGFNELPIESDILAEDIIYTGLSRLFIDEVDEIEKIFSSISSKELEKFLLVESKNNITKYSENNLEKSYDIFISYSTVNTEEAEKICYELEKEDYKCWYAPRDILPSQAYPEQIIQGIKEAKYFVLLHSKNSTVSRYVVREVTKALSLEKIIVPILLDNASLSENMEFILETCQWIDASNVAFEEKIEELKDILEKLR